jgi:hypothetical protein
MPALPWQKKRKSYAGPYSRSYPKITNAPGDRTANDAKRADTARRDGDPSGGDIRPRSNARSYSADGMSDVLPKRGGGKRR